MYFLCIPCEGAATVSVANGNILVKMQSIVGASLNKNRQETHSDLSSRRTCTYRYSANVDFFVKATCSLI